MDARCKWPRCQFKATLTASWSHVVGPKALMFKIRKPLVSLAIYPRVRTLWPSKKCLPINYSPLLLLHVFTYIYVALYLLFRTAKSFSYGSWKFTLLVNSQLADFSIKLIHKHIFLKKWIQRLNINRDLFHLLNTINHLNLKIIINIGKNTLLWLFHIFFNIVCIFVSLNFSQVW